MDPYLLVGCGMYVAGSMGVTMAFNLPRNDALARLDPSGREAAEQWPRYLAEWTFWNHVRTAGALAASATLMAAALLAEAAVLIRSRLDTASGIVKLSATPEKPSAGGSSPADHCLFSQPRRRSRRPCRSRCRQ